MNSRIVIPDHLHSSNFLLVCQESCSCLRSRKCPNQKQGPEDCQSRNNEVEPFPWRDAIDVNTSESEGAKSTNYLGKAIGGEPYADSQRLVLTGIPRAAYEDEGGNNTVVELA